MAGYVREPGEARGWTRRRLLQQAAGLAAAAACPWPARADLDEFAHLDATAQAALVASGQATPLELVDAAIARIEALNPRIGAFVTTFFDRARDQARSELPDGPFRGVPYAIKDLSNYAGTRTTFGCRLFEDNVADGNTPIVQRALDAGLVILGKTNTPEFGLISTTESLLLGPAHNPWNLAYHTAGSSGGAAAAVASGMLPFAQASDGGGSIRLPAAACGVFGLKPSRGRIADDLEMPGDIAVRFAVSRSVRDSARLLAASEERAPLSPVGFVTGPSSRRLRIGFSVAAANGRLPHPEVARAIEQTAALCESLGHRVSQAAPVLDGDAFLDHFFTIWSAAPARLESSAWLVGLTQLRLVRARDVLEPWTLGLAEMYARKPDGALDAAIAYLGEVSRGHAAFFEDYDVLLTPVASTPAVPLGEQAPDVPFEELLRRVVGYAGYTAQHNAAGTPAMSVPLSTSRDGLPIGSQFAAAVGGERTLLELAYELEQARPWADRHPPYSAVQG